MAHQRPTPRKFGSVVAGGTPSAETEAEAIIAVTFSIERVLTEDERALATALIELDRRRRRIAGCRAELDAFRQTLERFAAECQLKLASLFAELDHLRDAIALCERRIARLRGQARETASDDDSDDPFADDGPNWEEVDPGGPGDDDIFRTRRVPDLEDPETTAELRRAYLELARRFHPDLAGDEAERARRQELMLRINTAYHERDLDALITLALYTEPSEAPPLRSVAERLAWTRREIVRLEEQALDLRVELTSLRLGESGRLWQRHLAGENVLDELAANLRSEARRQRFRLNDLTALQDRLQRASRLGRRRTAAQTA